MRLTMQDKNEFLKAALKATDLDDLKRWLVGIVDAMDAEAASGKADVHMAVPPYVAPAANGHARPPVLGAAQDASLARDQWEKGALLA